MASRLARAGFDIDLLEGQAREDAFAHVLLRSRIECKSDKKCRYTGNVFMEYRYKGRPSGINATTADWWAIEFDEDCWLVMPTERVRALVLHVSKDPRRRVCGGDYNESNGVLVPVEWFVRPIKRTDRDYPMEPSYQEDTCLSRLSQEELEEIIERGMDSFLKVGQALLELRGRKVNGSTKQAPELF